MAKLSTTQMKKSSMVDCVTSTPAAMIVTFNSRNDDNVCDIYRVDALHGSCPSHIAN